ncbi:MAG: hypothetical protein H0U44_04000 [Flavisolibacter sp.]|jgi:hypothetical protein|nr:hypothetical protein [Flavisolibacter sp.]
MQTDKENQKGTPSSPAQAESPNHAPGDQNRQTEQNQEGEKRKVVAANDPAAFDDDYEVREEDKMGQNEIKTLDANNTSGTKRGDTFNKDANG